MLLVLELDGVLVWVGEEPDDELDWVSWDSQVVLKRPGLDEFLAAVGERFELAVWSSRPQAQAQRLAQVIFGADHGLKFIWGQEQAKKRFDEREWADYWIKELHKLKALGYELSDIVALDHDARVYQRSRSPQLLCSPFYGARPDQALAEILEGLLGRSHREG